MGGGSGGGGGGGSARPATSEERELWKEQAGLARETAKIARAKWDEWRSYGLPALKDLHQRVDKWASPSRIQHLQGAATSDISASYDRERSSLRNQLGRYGMTPGSGKFAAGLRTLALGRAADTAGAKTKVRTGILDRDLANRMGLVSMWRGHSGGQAMQGLTSASQSLGTVSGQMGRSRMFQNQLDHQSDMAAGAGLGQLAGNLGSAAIMAWSDIRLKENIKPVGELPKGIMVYEFNYIDDDENVYTGVLADQVMKVMPQYVGEEEGFLTVDYYGLMKEIMEDGN